MLRCSAPALSKNTIASAIARPARTACLSERRQRKRSSLACFDCRRNRQHDSLFAHIIVFLGTLLKPRATAVHVELLFGKAGMTSPFVCEHPERTLGDDVHSSEADLGREDRPSRSRSCLGRRC